MPTFCTSIVVKRSDGTQGVGKVAGDGGGSSHWLIGERPMAFYFIFSNSTVGSVRERCRVFLVLIVQCELCPSQTTEGSTIPEYLGICNVTHRKGHLCPVCLGVVRIG